MSLYNLLREPYFTEKTSFQKEGSNQCVFLVEPTANKIQIRESVEKAFKVKVLKVRTVNVTGKKKRLGRFVGKRSDWKKAMVTLRKGDTIDYFEGA